MGEDAASSGVLRLLPYGQQLVTPAPPQSRTPSSQEAPADRTSPQQMPSPTKGHPPQMEMAHRWPVPRR